MSDKIITLVVALIFTWLTADIGLVVNDSDATMAQTSAALFILVSFWVGGITLVGYLFDSVVWLVKAIGGMD